MNTTDELLWLFGSAGVVAAAGIIGGSEHRLGYIIGAAGLAIWFNVAVDAVCRALTKGRER